MCTVNTVILVLLEKFEPTAASCSREVFENILNCCTETFMEITLKNIFKLKKLNLHPKKKKRM